MFEVDKIMIEYHINNEIYIKMYLNRKYIIFFLKCINIFLCLYFFREARLMLWIMSLLLMHINSPLMSGGWSPECISHALFVDTSFQFNIKCAFIKKKHYHINFLMWFVRICFYNLSNMIIICRIQKIIINYMSCSI